MLANGRVNSNAYFDPDNNAFILQRGARPLGFHRLSGRFELTWIAGAHGLPQLNAVRDVPAGDTYDTSDFAALLLADPYFEILGNNATSDDVTLHPEGGIKIETDGGGTDSVILLPHLNTGQSPWSTVTWGTDQETEWEGHIKTGSAITTIVIWAGLKLTNTDVTATDNEQAFFRYAPATNSGKWQAISSINNVDVATDSGIAVAADTEYRFRITLDAARRATFYINDRRVKTSAPMTTATDLIPYIGILESGAGAKHIYVLGESISRRFA